MQTDDLLTYLFDGQPHLLFQPMARWLASSRRFTAFVTDFQNKIRKKLRTTQDQESLLDLQLELETAYYLLQERSLSVVYEPELSRGIRSPDFAVTFTTSLTFMLEVTRVQADPQNAWNARLADTVSAKLGQLLPQCSNIVLIGTEVADSSELRAAMLGLQQRAERNDLTFLQRHGFRDRADFFHHYQRLSEILVRGLPFDVTKAIIPWINPQAKYPLPGKVRTALHRSQTSGSEIKRSLRI
ncbi:MAG TPA: hypothetical protein VLX61_03980 [Anaerolineales bacterium]|nr:hypothetical protein [Anaerolineales bacterium]